MALLHWSTTFWPVQLHGNRFTVLEDFNRAVLYCTVAKRSTFVALANPLPYVKVDKLLSRSLISNKTCVYCVGEDKI